MSQTCIIARLVCLAPKFFTARPAFTSTANCCPLLQLKKLVIDVGTLAEGYKTAGQFIQIKVGDSKPGFFAIASAPDSNNQGLVEVLIKDGPPESAANLLCNISPGQRLTSSVICHVQPLLNTFVLAKLCDFLGAMNIDMYDVNQVLVAGAELSVSPVMGKGFRMERAPVADHPTCLLFATGSGISPIKALIESDELQVGHGTHNRHVCDPASKAHLRAKMCIDMSKVLTAHV